MENRELTLEEWVPTVPDRVKAETCWRFTAYPKALYLYELAWDDCAALMKDGRGQAAARQLIRSVGSVSANIQEAHSRGVGTKDYLNFLRIAEGSGRESKGWCFRASGAGAEDCGAAPDASGRDSGPPDHRETSSPLPRLAPALDSPFCIIYSPFSRGFLWPQSPISS